MGYCRINKASKQQQQKQNKTQPACVYIEKKKPQKIKKNTYSVFFY